MNKTQISSDNEEILTSTKRFDPFEACIEQLKLPSEARSIKRLIPYLETLIAFIQVLKNDNNNYRELLKQTALRMKHESKPENQMIIRNGDKGSQFYVILSGKIAILTLKPTSYYLNELEYITHLLKLRKHEELEVIRQCIQQNYRLCPFEDNFDQWMRNITHLKENKFGKDVLFSDNKDVIHMVEKTLYFINKKKENGPSLITVDKYIQLNQLTNINNLPEGRQLYQIFNYQLINQMETGQTFGNVALESKTSKRTATLITLQSTELGVIDKAEYDLLIKTVNEKAKKKFYNIIFSYSIYKELSKTVFEKKYVHLFVYNKKERGEKLVVEGQATDNVHFLLKGEFELVSKKNIVEVNLLIIHLKRLLVTLKRAKNKKDLLLKEEEFDEEKENEDLVINKQFRQPEHNKILFEKKPVKLGVIKDRDIIGLQDCVERQTKLGLITCSCVSFNSEVYSIPQKLFDLIAWNEDIIRPNLRQYQEKKIDYLIQRLLNHKEMVLSEIAKIDFDVSKRQKKESDLEKSRTFRNRLYLLEANSKFNANRNTAKPISNMQVFPVILNTVKENAGSINNNKSDTSRCTKVKGKEIEFKSPQKRNRNKCMYIQDYTTSIIQKNLYNNLFHSYLQSEDLEQSPRFNSVNSGTDQQNTSKNISTCTKETVSPYKKRVFKSQIGVNVIDCLIMDKFNKCYSTAMRNIANDKAKNS